MIVKVHRFETIDDVTTTTAPGVDVTITSINLKTNGQEVGEPQEELEK